jgi:hypothetical protein
MKRVILFSGLALSMMLLLGLGSAKANSAPAPEAISGNSQTLLGTYQITELEPEIVNKETLRKFQLTYENGNAPITIFLNERTKCKDYIVRSNVMEVQYVCNKQGFGATTVNSKFSMYPEQTNELFLSTEALGYQSKITDGEISIEKALGLIACYYPSLLKNMQNITAVN